MGGGVSVGRGEIVGVAESLGRGSPPSTPSSPPRSTNMNRYTTASAAITPRAMSIFLSRSVRVMALRSALGGGVGLDGCGRDRAQAPRRAGLRSTARARVRRVGLDGERHLEPAGQA